MALSEWGQNNRLPRRSFDDYPTPLSFTRSLTEREDFPGVTLEPAAGAGWMALGLRRAGLEVITNDIQRGGVDFLSGSFDQVDNVITNPPYSRALDFATRSLEVATKKVALLVKATFLEGTRRYEGLFRDKPPARVYITTRRMAPAGKGSGGAFAHAWVVWDADHEGPPVLGWFDPGKGDLTIPEGEPPDF